MRLRIVIAVAATASLVACGKTSAPTAKTDDEKALYALGALVSQNIQNFEFTDTEIALVKAGFDDGARNRSKLEPEEMEKLIPKLQELQTKRVEVALKRDKEAGEAYVTKAAAEAGAVKTASGVVIKTTKEGTGASPTASDMVQVHYEGKLLSGKVFDSSMTNDPATGKPKDPVTFPLGGVIPCWTEGVQQMKVGGEAQLVCPSDAAYGDQGQPPRIPGGSTLVFTVKLLDIVKPGVEGAGPHPPVPPTPAH
jgi:FKBP-type peptidyl-prolyl cis-trans isomerase FkpA